MYEAFLIPQLCEEPNRTQTTPPEANGIILNSFQEINVDSSDSLNLIYFIMMNQNTNNSIARTHSKNKFETLFSHIMKKRVVRACVFHPRDIRCIHLYILNTW